MRTIGNKVLFALALITVLSLSGCGAPPGAPGLSSVGPQPPNLAQKPPTPTPIGPSIPTPQNTPPGLPLTKPPLTQGNIPGAPTLPGSLLPGNTPATTPSTGSPEQDKLIKQFGITMASELRKNPSDPFGEKLPKIKPPEPLTPETQATEPDPIGAQPPKLEPQADPFDKIQLSGIAYQANKSVALLQLLTADQGGKNLTLFARKGDILTVDKTELRVANISRDTVELFEMGNPKHSRKFSLANIVGYRPGTPQTTEAPKLEAPAENSATAEQEAIKTIEKQLGDKQTAQGKNFQYNPAFRISTKSSPIITNLGAQLR